MNQDRGRMRITADIYQIVFGEDPRILSQAIKEHFRKNRLDQLNNSQLEELIPLIKEAYGRHIARIPNTQS